jgi:enolase
LFGKKLEPQALVKLYEDLILNYPIEYLEDGMAENDEEGWSLLNSALSNKVLLVGDDLTVTNPTLIEKYHRLIGGVIIKPNQIGTLTDTIRAIETARAKGLKIIVSHRSGESEDTFIADFAVGVGADFCKFGAPARGERTCKYNRLIEIFL